MAAAGPTGTAIPAITAAPAMPAGVMEVVATAVVATAEAAIEA